MTTQAARKPQDQRFNGLDMGALVGTVDAIKRDKTLAKFEFRARNRWINGLVNRSEIQDFYGAGAEDHSRKEPFTYLSGEPPVLLGNNEAAGAGEFLLHALAACVTSTTVMHAAARGIHIESISTELRGDVDLQGLLDLDPSVPAGYRQITVDVDIQADCTDAELDELLQFVHGHSPITDTISRPVPVTIRRVPRG
jgi:uncharacterized OsmC-like protein